MSKTPEKPLNQNEGSGWSQQMNRRTFLKTLGMGAAVVGAAAYAPGLRASTPPSPEATSPLTQPEAAEAGTIDWSQLPLVQGEPESSGLVEIAEPLSSILDQTRLVDSSTLNLRNADDLNDVLQQLPQNSLLRIIPEDPDSEKPVVSGYALSRVAQLQLGEGPDTLTEVDKNGRLALDLTKEVVPDGNGTISFTDPVKGVVTIPTSATIVSYEERDMNMPEASLVRNAADFASTFSKEVVGGLAGAGESVSLRAWNAQEINPFQRAVLYAAIDEAVKKPEERTGVVEVDSILKTGMEVRDGKLVETGPEAKFSLAVHSGDGYVDVISRTGDGNQNDKFIITRVLTNSDMDSLNIGTVQGVGFATWEGLAEAYGTQAETYAQNATTLQETQENLEQLANLPQAGVFLAGMGENGIIAAKNDALIPEKRIRTYLMSQGITPDKTVRYERLSDSSDGTPDYRARLYATDRTDYQNTKEIIHAEAKLIELNGNAEWVVMPEEVDMKAYVDTYASVYALDTGEVRENLSYEQKMDADGNSYMVMLHNRVPLMVHRLGAEGSAWEEATPEICGKLNENPITVFTSVDGAEPYTSPVYKKTYEKFSGLAPSGSFLKSSLDRYRSTTEEFVAHVAESGESLRAHTSFFHQVIKQELGETATREQVDQFVDDHIESLFGVLDKFKDKLPKIEIIFANEPRWKSGQNMGWEQSPLYSAYGEQWPVEIFVRLYQAAKDRGYDIGNQVTFMHNDYGVEVDDPAGGYTKADMVREDIARTKAAVAARLGIPADEVPMVMGFQGWGAFGAALADHQYIVNGTNLITMDHDQAVNQIAANIQSYADVLDPSGTKRPVKVTEIGTYGASEDEQAEYVKRWVEGIKASGRADSIGFWSPLREEGMKGGDNLSLFEVPKIVIKEVDGKQAADSYRPRKMYYALNSALYS